MQADRSYFDVGGVPPVDAAAAAAGAAASATVLGEAEREAGRDAEREVLPRDEVLATCCDCELASMLMSALLADIGRGPPAASSAASRHVPVAEMIWFRRSMVAMCRFAYGEVERVSAPPTSTSSPALSSVHP